MKKIIVSLICIVALFASSMVVFAEDTAVAPEARVDEITTDAGTAFFYVPVGSDQLANRNCTTPIIVVLGDGFTAETVPAVAESTGIADISYAEGAVVAFISPIGDTWADEDVAAYASIFPKFSDSADEYIDGVNAAGNYCGSQQFIYLLADGAAADFAATHFNTKIECFIDYGMYQLTQDVTPACTALFNVTAAVEPATGDYETPMIVAEGEFAPENVAATFKAMKNVRRQSSVIVENPNLEELGVREVVNYYPTSVGDAECYVYTTEAFDTAEAGTVPLVFMFHGGGNHAQYFAWASGMIDIAASENVLLVSVNKYGIFKSANIVELLDDVLAVYPQVDASRVYATGFSMGAVMCWNLALHCPERFAGIMPCDAGYMCEDVEFTGILDANIVEEFIDTPIPAFYVAGGRSFSNEACEVDEAGAPNNVAAIVQRLFAMDHITDDYTYDASASEQWGYAPTHVETVENTTFKNNMIISYYDNVDGEEVVALCFDEEKAHETYAQDGYEGWNFIKKFSRNEDGTININK